MIAPLIHIGPHSAKYPDMKGDANEALLIIGVTLFWAAVLPLASVFLAVAALREKVKRSWRRRLVGWPDRGFA